MVATDGYRFMRMANDEKESNSGVSIKVPVLKGPEDFESWLVKFEAVIGRNYCNI